VTLADVCFAGELSLFFNEKTRGEAIAALGLAPILDAKLGEEYPRALAHFARLRKHPAFAPEMEPYLASSASDRARAQPGFFGKLHHVLGMSTQGCAESHQTCIVGLSHDLSSSVPALMSAFGIISAIETIGEPQVLQNRRCTGWPLTPRSS